MKKFLCAVGFVLLNAAQMISAQANPALPSADQFKALLDKAYEQANLWSSGSPAFHLRANTKAYGAKGSSVEGTYELWWVTKDRWRADVSWNGQLSSQIAVENQMWITGEDMDRADSSRVTNVLKTWQGIYLDLRKLKIQAKPGAAGAPPSACVSGHRADMPPQTICLDPMTGSLSETQLGDQRWEYSDYEKLWAKRYPRRIRYIDGKDPVVDVNVEVLELLNIAQTEAFAPPQGTAAKSWCSDMVKPVATQLSQGSVIPRNYTGLGMVIFTIDEKGRTTDVRAYDFGGAHAIDKNEKRALMLNTFKPATCHGTAVPGEVVVWQ